MRFVDILVGTGCLFGKDHSTRLDPKGDTYDFVHPMHSNTLLDIKSLAFCQRTFHGSRKSLGKGVKLKPKAARAASEISIAQSVLFSSPAYLAYIYIYIYLAYDSPIGLEVSTQILINVVQPVQHGPTQFLLDLADPF